MKLLFLSSNVPRLGHFRAGETIVALLLRQLRAAGHTVELGLIRTKPIDGETRAALERDGVLILPSFDGFMVPDDEERGSLLSRVSRGLRRVLGFGKDVDPPVVRGRQLAAALDGRQADAVLLFWDTLFEKALPWLRTPSVGYLARPPTASELSRLDADPARGWRMQWRRLVVLRSEARHFARMRHLRRAVNICALDAALYTDRGVPSSYLSNTWEDPFGQDWLQERQAAEGRRDGIHILGNLGGLQATGNTFGLTYFAERVLPLLGSKLGGQDWTVNICGRFALPEDLGRKLTHPNVAIRGFVDDIDEEVAGNAIFLLLNNAGPYTGGYTRVIYAMATGACLVAHRRLADSMPELIDGKNCLLGDEPQDFLRLLDMAAGDAALRRRIGASARRTYENRYHPQAIAQRLADLGAQVSA